MPSPDAQQVSMKLHNLPSDVLVDVLQRVRDPTSLVRLASLSSSSLSVVAKSDAVWAPTFQQIWGKGLYDKVIGSMQVCDEDVPAVEEQQDAAEIRNEDLRKLHFERMARIAPETAPTAESAETEAATNTEDVELAMPDWMMEHCCLSSDQEKTLHDCREQWHSRPSLMTAFSVLAKVVPQDFNSDPERCMVRLTSGEEDVQDKARVVSSFIYYFSPNRQGVQNVRKAAVQCMTVKSVHDPLSLAIRREYVRNFNVTGLSLPAAMKSLLTYGAMPTEAARICRLLWVFAAEYHCQHGGIENTDRPEPKKSTPEDTDAPIPTGGPWVSQDVVYLLMWSLLVLNADAQNPHVKTKMQLHEWVKNTALALNGAGHVPAGVRPDGTLEDVTVGAGSPQINHHQSWGGLWGEQHRVGQTRVCVNEQQVGAAVTADTLGGMYAEVLHAPLLAHVSREPRVAKGLQRLTESTAGLGAFSLSNLKNGLISWMTGSAAGAQPVPVR